MRSTLLIPVVVTMAMAAPAGAQEAVAPPSGQMSLASTMKVYVFPTAGQTPQDQSKDEATCYDWAVQNTGSDPFELSKKAQADQQRSAEAMQQTEKVGHRSGAHGAVKGAAAGALVGEIASDDAGSGAAWGAAAGLVHGRRHGRRARYEAQTQVAADAVVTQADTAEDVDNFKKAFSVCLEAKNYQVKY
jgi:hypothetical protein